ncbi:MULTISPECIES: hypothetical protein [unclassified Arthrobacter]|uniref:hypothetical protein n=1 Tax=unclassified Arthrobacter TaxID=235627 RepID=UPI00339B9496
MHFALAWPVFGAGTESASTVCSSAGLSGKPAAEEVGGLSIRDGGQSPGNLTARQLSVAGDYISVGKQQGVLRDGQIIAIMIALQESSLRVLANTSVSASLG